MISNKRYVSTIILLLIIAGGSFFYGLRLGAKGYTYSGNNYKIVNQNDAPHDVDYGLLWSVIDILNQKYIDKPIDQQKILYGAVSGAVNAVGDPYTMFFDPTSYSDFKVQLSGTFSGIGAEVGAQNGQLVIISPLDGSPAKKAGIVAGDVILKINDADASNMTLQDAVNKIRGQKGTSVKLSIYRPSDKKSMDLNIVRDTINVPSVKYSVKDDNGKKVEVVSISTFGDDTVNLFKQAAQDAQSNHVSGILLDLRDDPGGYLDAAVNVASYWVDAGKLVVGEAHSDGTVKQYNATGNNFLHNIPTVVLINDGSASAAEILSGALHDYGFAKLVGKKSFGKGSVQELVDLPYNTAVKVTVAKWLTPKGVNINHNGINPDIAVDMPQDQSASGKDPQMDKALELLK